MNSGVETSDDVDRSDKKTSQINDCGTDNVNDNIVEDYQLFECNICLDTSKDPVVSLCGHLFCWPCLHQWLETRPNQQICPVCKAVVNKDKVVPIYGRGCDNPEDPRKKKIPPRPSGTRSEPVNNNSGFPHFTVGENFHISLGIGAFPFEFFSSLFSYGTNITFPAAFDVGSTNDNGANSSFFSRWIPRTDDEILQHCFLWLGVIFILWLLLA